ncbi:ERF superfamily protein [compost metagenome]
MSQLIERQEQPMSVAITKEGAMLDFIQRAAADPTVDIEKLERLIVLSERMQAKTAEAAFNAAMAQMQCEMPTVFEGATNTHTKNTYATLDDINRSVKSVMQAHGFAVTFKVVHVQAGVSVTGILMHAAGHREETTLLLPVDTGPGRSTVQAVGSSVTYGKRYVMCALLNITTGDAVDDDGAGAKQEPLVTELQAKQINALLAKCSERTKAGFEKMYATADQVPKINFDGVIAGLNNSISKAKDAE